MNINIILGPCVNSRMHSHRYSHSRKIPPHIHAGSRSIRVCVCYIICDTSFMLHHHNHFMSYSEAANIERQHSDNLHFIRKLPGLIGRVAIVCLVHCDTMHCIYVFDVRDLLDSSKKAATNQAGMRKISTIYMAYYCKRTSMLYYTRIYI